MDMFYQDDVPFIEDEGRFTIQSPLMLGLVIKCRLEVSMRRKCWISRQLNKLYILVGREFKCNNWREKIDPNIFQSKHGRWILSGICNYANQKGAEARVR